MIDMHSHIAWDVDDGLSDREEAEKALRQAAEDGITQIVSTPHITPGTTSLQDLEQIRKRQEELIDLGEAAGIKIHTGGEILMNDQFVDYLYKDFYPAFEGSNYLLVEFDVFKDIQEISDADDYLYEITAAGYIPVIAHIERYFKKQLDINQVRSWKENGYVLQINRTSLLGLQGKINQKNSERLLKEGLVHLIATDTHRTVGSRIEKLSDAAVVANKLGGENASDILMQENPKRILGGKSVVNIEKRSGSGLLGRLFR